MPKTKNIKKKLRFDWNHFRDNYYEQYYKVYRDEEMKKAKEKKKEIDQQVSLEAFQNFPVIKLGFAIEDHIKAKQGESIDWNIVTQDREHDANIYKMTLFDYDALDQLRNSRKNIFLASDKPSPEMKAIQDSLKEYMDQFNAFRTMQFEEDGITNAQAELVNKINALETQCRTYLDHHRKRPWSDSGKARRSLVENALRILQGQKEAIHTTVNAVQESNERQNAARLEYETAEKNRRFEAVKAQVDEVAKNRALADVTAKEAAYQNDVEQRANQITQLAGILIGDKHNPFVEYSSEGTISMKELSEFLSENGIKGTYTSDALIDLSHMNLVDQIMGESRDELDYAVKYQFQDQDGNPILDENNKEINFRNKKPEEIKEYQKNHPNLEIRCMATRIFADPVTKGYESGDIAAFVTTINTNGMFLVKETAANITNLDEMSFNEIFSKEDFNRITKRLNRYKDAIAARRENLSGKTDQAVINVFSQKDIKRRIAMDTFEERNTRPENVMYKYRFEPSKEVKDVIVQSRLHVHHPNYFSEAFMNNLSIGAHQVTRTYNYSKIKLDPARIPLTKTGETAQALSKMMPGHLYGQDSELQDILRNMKAASNLKEDSLYTHFALIGTRKLKSEYDELAVNLYKGVNSYIARSSATKNPQIEKLLKEWRDTVFSPGKLQIPTDFIDKTAPQGDDDLLTSAIIRNWESQDYVGLKDFSDEPLFPHKPVLSDIKQGKLGNCYFLAALATLIKERPDAIEELMVESEDHQSVFCRFYNDEKKAIYVKVSKKIPVASKSDYDEEPERFANSERTPLWVQIYEKAYLMSGLRDSTNKKLDDLSGYKQFKKDIEDAKKAMAEKGESDEKFTLSPDKEKAVFNNGYHKLKGGLTKNMFTHLAGTDNESFVNHVFSSAELLVILRQADQECLFGVEDKYQNDKKTMFDAIMKEASKKLAEEKTRIAELKDLEGNQNYKKVVLHDRIYMEDVIDAIQNVKLNQFDSKEVQAMSNEICEAIKDYQLQANAMVNRMEIRQEGLYSEAANRLFEIIKDGVDGKRLIGCGFKHELGEYNNDQFEKIEMERGSAQALHTLKSGYVTRHAYSVIDYREENGLKYVVVRNPWARGERVEESVNFEGEKFTHQASGIKDITSENAGVFEVELNSFVGNLNRIVLETDKDQMEKTLIDEIAKQIVGVIESKYKDAYDTLKANIKASTQKAKKKAVSKGVAPKGVDEDAVKKEMAETLKKTNMVKMLAYHISMKPEIMKQYDQDKELPKGLVEKIVDDMVKQQKVAKENENVQKNVNKASAVPSAPQPSLK